MDIYGSAFNEKQAFGPSLPSSKDMICSYTSFYFDCLGDSHEEQLPVQPHVCCQFCGSTSNHEGSEGRIWISISCCILSFPPIHDIVNYFEILPGSLETSQLHLWLELRSLRCQKRHSRPGCFEPRLNPHEIAHHDPFLPGLVGIRMWCPTSLGIVHLPANNSECWCEDWAGSCRFHIIARHFQCTSPIIYIPIDLFFWQERAWKDGSFEGCSQCCFEGWKSAAHQNPILNLFRFFFMQGAEDDQNADHADQAASDLELHKPCVR